MATFVLKVEKDAIALDANASETVAWTITGEDKTTHVVAEAYGYTAKVDASAKSVTISAGEEIKEGYVIIKAIRNSDGASASQYIAVNAPESGEGGKEEKDNFTVEITDIKATSFSFTIKPSDPDMKYFYNVAAIEDMEGYDDDTIFKEDMAILATLATTYGRTFEEVLDIFTTTGEVSEKCDKLDPNSEYVLYAFGLTAENTRSTKITRVKVKTLESSTSNSGFTKFLGTWDVKGKKGTADYEGTITISEDETEKSYLISGIGKYDMHALFDAEHEVMAIPFGAANVIGKFSFSTSGTQWGCWMGYDGKSVYKAGSFYFGISEDGNEINSLSANSAGEQIYPIGFAMGVYKLNEDGTIGEYMSSTFGDKYLFSSIIRSAAPSSMMSSRKSFRALESIMPIAESDEKCILEIR